MVDENLRAAMRCYARVGRGSEAWDAPDLAMTFSGLNCSVFNSAMVTAPNVNAKRLRALIAQAGRHYGSRKVGWTFWLCDDLLCSDVRTRTRAIFRESAMHMIATAPGMLAESMLPPVRRAADLSFRPIEDAERRWEFANISSTVFSLPFSVAREIYGSASLWGGPMKGWVGYHHGMPVSVISVVIAAGTAGVYSLGTLPQFQRRGFGECILRHALAQVREETGVETSVLQTTKQGMKLYMRLGYRVVTNFSVFVRESCEAF